MTSCSGMKARGVRCAVVLLALAGTALAEDGGRIKGKVTFKGGREALPKHLRTKKIPAGQANPQCVKRIGTNKARVQEG